MQSYKEKLIDLLLEYNAFRTGEFKLKSGALSPYFVNFGAISDAKGMYALGEVFADCLAQELGANKFDVVVGPAYKGITIALATATGLYQKYGANKAVNYNRKEMKMHGADAGSVWVGGEIASGARVVLVDDVFTTGGTKLEIIEQLRLLPAKVEVTALLVGVDRQQPASQGGEKFDDFCKSQKTKGLAVVRVDEVIDSLLQRKTLQATEAKRIKNYILTGSL